MLSRSRADMKKKTRRNEEWMKGNERLRSPCVEICWLRSIAAA